MADYVAHLARHGGRTSDTLCGEPWQGWSAHVNSAAGPVFVPAYPATLPICEVCLRKARLLADSMAVWGTPAALAVDSRLSVSNRGTRQADPGVTNDA